jgi:hypothetical protein
LPRSDQQSRVADYTAFTSLGVDNDTEWRENFAATGVVAFGPPALSPRTFGSLQREALRQRRHAWSAGANSTVEQSNLRAPLGPAGLQFLRAKPTIALLTRIAGFRVAHSPEASCHTYYESPDHFCGVHLDRPDTCELTLLLCLAAEWVGSASPGMALHLFGSRYRPGQVPQLRITSVPNRLLVLLGGSVFHGRPQLATEERAAILTACFRRT